MPYRTSRLASGYSEFPYFFEPLEPRVQLSAAPASVPAPSMHVRSGGTVQPFIDELQGPGAVNFGDVADGDTNPLDTVMTVTIQDTSGLAVQVGTPYLHDTTGISVDTGGFPSGQDLLSEESASFQLDLNTSTDVTVNTIVTVPYNDGQQEFLDIPVNAIVGNGSPPDTTPPTAKIVYAKALRVVAKYYYFAVEYSDDTGVDVNTLSSQNILVTRKHYPTLHANFISASPDADSPNVTVVYAARYGPRGTWTAAFDGQWNLSLAKDQVADTGGNFTAAKSFGPFAIIIPATKAAVEKSEAPADVPQITSMFAMNTLNPQDAVWNEA